MGRTGQSIHPGWSKQPPEVESVNGCAVGEKVARSIEVSTAVGTEGKAADIRHIPLGNTRHRGNFYLRIAGITHQRGRKRYGDIIDTHKAML
jgi:hypothetical protein